MRPSLFERAALDFRAKPFGLVADGHLGTTRALATVPGAVADDAWIVDEVAGVARVVVVDWRRFRGAAHLEYNTIEIGRAHV